MAVAIIGIGIHPFGQGQGRSALAQGALATREALRDADLDWSDVDFAVGGSANGGFPDSLVSELGLTGLPFTNVINGCATGGQVLSTACAMIESGRFKVGLAVGFDKHPRGAFEIKSEEWGLGEWYGQSGLALTPQFFAMKINRYMHDHHISSDSLIRVAQKNYRNGALNPNAWRRTAFSYDEIAKSQMVSDPLRKYMFCSPGEGAVALLLCDASVVSRFTNRPIWLAAVVSRTRLHGSFEVFSPALALDLAPSPSVEASHAAFLAAGLTPDDVDVAQIQDTESGAEIIHMAETGLCAHGDQERLLREGATEIGGRLPINTDGGCMANGEPVGASGLRQVFENVLQLRGAAGPRQVPGGPKVGFTHVYGAPGLSAVTILTT